MYFCSLLADLKPLSSQMFSFFDLIIDYTKQLLTSHRLNSVFHRIIRDRLGLAPIYIVYRLLDAALIRYFFHNTFLFSNQNLIYYHFSYTPTLTFHTHLLSLIIHTYSHFSYSSSLTFHTHILPIFLFSYSFLTHHTVSLFLPSLLLSIISLLSSVHFFSSVTVVPFSFNLLFFDIFAFLCD